MIERFFAYSRDHEKAIRLLVMTDEAGKPPMYKNVIAVSWDDRELWYLPNSRVKRAQKARSLSRERILSADYVRGDDGDTLRFEMEREG